jgi:hypothetical protein
MFPSLTDAIYAAYGGLRSLDGAHRPIHPFIGAAFTDGDGSALRVMAVGVNAYCAARDVNEPGRWALGFRQQEWVYQRRVLADLSALAGGLAGSAVAGGRPFLGIESVYLTNAVKRWLPGAKRAHAVAEDWFKEGAPVLNAELVALAEAERLPHVVVVVGHRPWGYVHPAFRPATAPWAATYTHMGPKNRLFHYVNLVQVREAGTVRPLLMLRIRHSSASHWNRGWTPARLLAEPTFQRVAGLGDNLALETGGIEHGA